MSKVNVETVYVATRFDCWLSAKVAVAALAAVGIKSTSNWIAVAEAILGECHSVSKETRQAEADQDLDDCYNSDAILLLVPPEGGCGMWVEMGYMLRRAEENGTRVVCVGPASTRCVFAELPHVKEFARLSDAIAYLAGADDDELHDEELADGNCDIGDELLTEV